MVFTTHTSAVYSYEVIVYFSILVFCCQGVSIQKDQFHISIKRTPQNSTSDQLNKFRFHFMLCYVNYYPHLSYPVVLYIH
jgi:hypothetical protein